LKGKLTNPLCKALADQIGSESTWPKERLASLKSIALDASLQSDHFRSFILGVVTHKCKEVVSILSDLLKSKTFCSYWKTNFSWEDKVKVCNHWLTTYFHKAGMNPKDKILSVVEACELLCKTDTLKTDKVLCEAMDKEVHRLVLKTKIESVMDAFKDAQRRAPEIQQRLTLLLRSAIKQQTGTGDCRSRYRQMIHMLGFDVSRERKRDLEKVKLDRAKEEVLLVMLETMLMPTEGENEEIFKAMISTSEGWLLVLSALNPQSALVRHPKVLTVTAALQSLTDPVQRRDLPVVFFLRLKDEDINLLAKFCALASSLESNIGQHDVDDRMTQLYSERGAAQTFCERFSKLEHTIRFLEAVSKDIVVVSDAQTLICEVNKRKKEKNTVTLKDVLDVNYWGELLGLIDLEEGTTQVQGSVMFANVARMCLTEEFAESQISVEDVTDFTEVDSESKGQSSTAHTAAEILCLLETKGLQQLTEACTYLIDRTKDPSIKEVDMLLSGVVNDEFLHRELKVISSFCGGFIPQETEKMLIN